MRTLRESRRELWIRNWNNFRPGKLDSTILKFEQAKIYERKSHTTPSWHISASFSRRHSHCVKFVPIYDSRFPRVRSPTRQRRICEISLSPTLTELISQFHGKTNTINFVDWNVRKTQRDATPQNPTLTDESATRTKLVPQMQTTERTFSQAQCYHSAEIVKEIYPEIRIRVEIVNINALLKSDKPGGWKSSRQSYKNHVSIFTKKIIRKKIRDCKGFDNPKSAWTWGNTVARDWAGGFSFGGWKKYSRSL